MDKLRWLLHHNNGIVVYSWFSALAMRSVDYWLLNKTCLPESCQQEVGRCRGELEFLVDLVLITVIGKNGGGEGQDTEPDLQEGGAQEEVGQGGAGHRFSRAGVCPPRELDLCVCIKGLG